MWIKSKEEKQKGLGIHQVPITTKPSWLKYHIDRIFLAESKRDLVINQVPITTKQACWNYGRKPCYAE